MAAWVRGPTRAPLDDLSAQRAKNCSTFLRQVLWYRWDFRTDVIALRDQATDVFRDKDRRVALGIGSRVKVACAGVIASTMADMAARRPVPADDRQRSRRAGSGRLQGCHRHHQGIGIEAPRYGELTDLLSGMAQDAGIFIEIVGNDDILFMMTSDTPHHEGVLYSVT